MADSVSAQYENVYQLVLEGKGILCREYEPMNYSPRFSLTPLSLTPLTHPAVTHSLLSSHIPRFSLTPLLAHVPTLFTQLSHPSSFTTSTQYSTISLFIIFFCSLDGFDLGDEGAKYVALALERNTSCDTLE